MTSEQVPNCNRTSRHAGHYYAAVSAALQAHDMEAVPGILMLMALGGFGHEAEELRRLMISGNLTVTIPGQIPTPADLEGDA